MFFCPPTLCIIYFLTLFFQYSCADDTALLPPPLKTDLIISESAVVEEDNEEENGGLIKNGLADSVFVPTNEWQTIKPGQAIPRGLHVRMNLETGQSEAKILDEKTQETPVKNKGFKYWKTEDGKHGMVNADGTKTFSREQLKKALKEFEAQAAVESENASDEKIKNQFRSYDELKEDFVKMRANMKTDAEIMTDVLNEYRQTNTTNERKIILLEDLEYLVHQIDNAQNFVDMGGFNLVNDLLNHTEPKFREKAAFIVGSSSQSNPKVQIAALENGILHRLIRAFNNEQSNTVRRKYLFAISAVLRHFPYAQKKFLELGGFHIFGETLRRSTVEEKQKIKIITLLYDLLYERREIETQLATYAKDSPIHFKQELLKKFNQYKEAPLKDAMIEDGWCPLIAEMLQSPDLDSQEKILKTMDMIYTSCRKQFQRYAPTVRLLVENYKDRLSHDDDNEFLIDLLNLAQNVLSHFVKEEL